MKQSIKGILWWAPRILSILFLLLLSLFALDVFGEGFEFWETLLALIIHLTPAIVLAIVLLLAWHWEWVGALVFIGAGILYLIVAKNQHWSAYLIITGIPILIGCLFLAGWLLKDKPGRSLSK